MHQHARCKSEAEPLIKLKTANNTAMIRHPMRHPRILAMTFKKQCRIVVRKTILAALNTRQRTQAQRRFCFPFKSLYCRSRRLRVPCRLSHSTFNRRLTRLSNFGGVDASLPAKTNQMTEQPLASEPQQNMSPSRRSIPGARNCILSA